MTFPHDEQEQKQQELEAMAERELYRLTQSYYEETYEWLFYGEPNRPFKQLCDSLMPEAAMMAVTAARGWVGWTDVMDQLVRLLEREGFVRHEPTSAHYFGSGIMGGGSLVPRESTFTEEERKLFGEALKLVAKTNQRVARELREDLLNPKVTLP